VPNLHVQIIIDTLVDRQRFIVEHIQRRQAIRSTGAVIAGAALAGCGGSPPSADGSPADDGTPTDGSGGGATVEMTDKLAFDPEKVTIAVGDTVTWDNVGSIGHSVTAYEGEIPDGAAYFASGGFESQSAAEDAYSTGDPESGDIPGGETYEHTFGTPGTYEYFCIPHESAGMVGTVEVTDG
jgi:plastocyanin